ncbi:MAG: phosphoglycerate kinase [Clostridiales bacterium]|nr:phosphoglycerate kinase [Clostridiales bacterium]
MKKTIRDFDFDNKKVIVRCDFNVPIKNKEIVDDTRIVKALKTINYLIEHNAKIILMSHLGRIKTKEDIKENSLYLVKLKLEELLNKKISFSSVTRGSELEEKVKALNPKDILLVENTRFEDLEDKKESSNNQELAKYWSSLGEIFINDAFGTIHRSHASNVGIASYLDSGIGFLVEEEIKYLDTVKQAKRPLTIIMGGAKVSDKLELIYSLAEKADYILLGGAMSLTFLSSLGYNMGKSLIEKEQLNNCKNILDRYKEKLILPVDFKCFKSFDNSDYIVKKVYEFDNDDIALDIDNLTVKLYKSVLNKTNTCFWNGPLGVVEKNESKDGSLKVLEYLNNLNITTILGGGDIVGFATKEKMDKKITFLSTGGGATLEYLSDKKLPGYEAIADEK